MSGDGRSRPAPSEEQQAVIDLWGVGLSILAGAGSGKTTTLVAKCQALIAKNPEARFVAVSFTEKSASDLRAKLSNQMPLDRHRVMTIHGLCGTIVRENPRELLLFPEISDFKRRLDGQEGVMSETESSLLWEKALEELWRPDLPEDVLAGMEALLNRESWSQLRDLLITRVRDLAPFGALKFMDKQDPSLQALAKVSSFVLERYQHLKHRRGVLDFNDLELGAQLTLEDPLVRERYHRRYDLVLVDEFQDTNPLQASIVRQFAKPDGSNLCVVGDPKQSIYRFRDADVSVFEDFCNSLPRQIHLTKNFRSRPAVINFVNDVCAPAFGHNQMTYLPLAPGREMDEAEGMPIVPMEISRPKELADWIHSQVAKGVSLDKMVLLLRRIRGRENWIKELVNCGIPLAVSSGGLFWEDARVHEMVALLKWWSQPSNALSGAVFLRAPWVGVPDETLDQWIREDKTWVEPFFKSQHPLAASLSRLRAAKPARPAEVLEALLVSPEIEAELGGTWLGLWHRCEELSTSGLSFQDVVSDLALAMEERRRDRDVPPPQNLGQLPVLTLHGAKGLEFDHVILIDFPEKPLRTHRMPLLFWDRHQGVFLGKRNEKGDRDREHVEEVPWRKLEQKKNLAESMRLFYVALTRARERLILVTTASEEEPKEREGSVYELDFWRGWIEGPRILPENIQIAPQEKIARPEAAPILPFVMPKKVVSPLRRARHSVTEWMTLQTCPRKYEYTYLRPMLSPGVNEALPNDADNPDLDFRMSQRELGTRVHACLETLDFDGLHKLEAEVGAPRFASKEVVDWAKNSLLMDPELESWSELPFEIPIRTSTLADTLVGSIDRLVRLSENEYVIVDFKVTEELKSPKSLMLRYGLQMELYAWAIQKLTHENATISALLVNISGKSVQEIPVTIRGGLDIEALVKQAGEIANGQAGAPKPNLDQCRMCGVREFCAEGQKIFMPAPDAHQNFDAQIGPSLSSH